MDGRSLVNPGGQHPEQNRLRALALRKRSGKGARAIRRDGREFARGRLMICGVLGVAGPRVRPVGAILRAFFSYSEPSRVGFRAEGLLPTGSDPDPVKT